jgi:uncharacterized delta-60 repeat protein
MAPLPLSGPISMSQITTELQLGIIPLDANYSVPSSSLRTSSFEAGFYSTPDSFSEFYGYSSFSTLDTGYAASLDAVAIGVGGIVSQSDGKVVVGAQFTIANGVTRNRIARFNTDGTLDTGYNPNANNIVRGLAIQSDGKIIVGGDFTTIGGTTRNYIARLNTDGTLDTGFNPNASARLWDGYSIQSDGKIIVGGDFTTIGGTTRNRIARLNTDGTVDTGFNPNANGGIFASAIQSDGKIVIGGGFTTIGGTTRNRIARLNSDGTLDTGFNPNIPSSVYDIKILSSGKIMVGGNFNNVNGISGSNASYLVRLNTDGTVDTSWDVINFFGKDWSNPDTTGIAGPVYCIEEQSDGKILVGGRIPLVGQRYRDLDVNYIFTIVRLHPDGHLDKSFFPNPIIKRVDNLGVGITDFVILSDGIVAIGNFTEINGNTSVSRIAKLK